MPKSVVVTTTNNATTQHLRKVNVLASVVAGTSLPSWTSVTSDGLNTFETVVSVTPTLVGAVTAVVTAGGGGVTTSYANTGGTGARAGVITLTTNIIAGAGSPASMIDGLQADAYFFGAAQTNRTIVFDFGVGASKVINEFKWYQDVTSTHGGSNRLEGSNDNSSYTTFPETFTLGSTATMIIPVTNSTGYRYYRLQIPGSTSAGPYIREIEFKIG